MDRDLTCRKTQGAQRAEEEEQGDTDTVCPEPSHVAGSVHLGPGLAMFKERPSSWAQQKNRPKGAGQREAKPHVETARKRPPSLG